MVHIFSFKNDQLAYDTESQAFIELDNLSKTCLELYIETNGKRPPDKTLKLFTNFDIKEMIETCDEIDTLIGEQILFAPSIDVSFDQLYPDQPKIKSMCLHICHDCNLRCKYCFAGTGDYSTGNRNFLDIETGKKAIDFLIQSSGNRYHLDIDFFGGEPLLNWKVVKELVFYCKEQEKIHNKELRLTMTTNAMLLDEEKSKFINEHFKNVVLSIDGRKEVQNDLRPTKGEKGSYDIVMPNIKRFVSLRGDKEYYVRGTFTKLHKDFAADVLHLADEGLPQLSMEPVVAPENKPYALTDEDLEDLKLEYETLAIEMLKRHQTEADFNFFHFMVDLDGGPCLFKRLKGCGVGSEYCAVTPEGNIYPCHQFVGEDEFIMGNVHDTPITLKTPYKKDFYQYILPNKVECQSCWAKYYCSGGCAANAFHSTGNLQGVYEFGCKLMRKRLECALWLTYQKQN